MPADRAIQPARPDVSVIIPVGARQSEAVSLFYEYVTGLDATGSGYEVIFVLDGPNPTFARALDALRVRGERFIVVSLKRAFGEATALMAGLEVATGPLILTLPAYQQIEAEDIGRLLAAADYTDVAVGWRQPRFGGAFDRMRRSVFHRLLRAVTRLDFHDLGCGARACRRHVLADLNLYGDQHRFLPVLAERRGFRVEEVVVRQSPMDRYGGRYGSRDYARRFLDIVSIFFLVRFTKRPLRFFGAAGLATFALGALLGSWIVLERLFLAEPLANRPALLLSTLLVVLGLHFLALGLLGELMIFTHARQLRDYNVESVFRFTKPATEAANTCTLAGRKVGIRS